MRCCISIQVSVNRSVFLLRFLTDSGKFFFSKTLCVFLKGFEKEKLLLKYGRKFGLQHRRSEAKIGCQ